MKHARIAITLALVAAISAPVTAYSRSPQDAQGQQPGAADGPPQPEGSVKAKQQSDRKLLKELDTPYRRWLDEDVVYIITPDERTAFLRLTTNEEREQFIEAFWQRRNPNPESPDNDFKDEHYRRIAYANARFGSGLPGWKTDRGHVYILWGPPDERDAHPNGGAWERLPEEGGGSTTTYPYEDWRYRHIDGIGDDVNIEFVDKTWAGEYHLTMDPCEKDALANTAAGPAMTEMTGDSPRSFRAQNPNGTSCAKSQLADPIDPREFTRIQTFADILTAPQAKDRPLEPLVSSKVLRNQINFQYKYYFMRVTSSTDLVPITVQVPNRQLTFENKDGVNFAEVSIYGRISTVSGKVVQSFDDTLKRDFPDSLMRQSREGLSVYQKGVPLRPGLYRLDLVIKDLKSGNVGVESTSLAVPRFDDEKLTSSTMILADQMERVGEKQIGLGQFVIGDAKVRPRVNSNFTTAESLSVYVQLYNLTLDEKTHKADAGLVFTITRIDGNETKEVFRKRETSMEQFGPAGRLLTIEKRIPLATLDPGRYRFAVEVTDNLTKETVTPSADFTVKDAPAPAAAANK